MPTSAVDSITLAIEHTKQQLFKPFRIGQWSKLAFVGLLAGELGSSGFSPSNFNLHRHTGAVPRTGLPNSLGIDPALVAALIAAAIVAALAIGTILMYVGSVMRFVLFDSIIAKECHVGASWSRRLGAGWRFFLWKLLYLFLVSVGLFVLIGFPLVFAFAKGWLKDPKAHLPALVLGGGLLLLVVLVFLVVTAVIFVLTKDFVVPLMALDDINAFEAWRRLVPMLKAELGAYGVYILMKIVLAVVAGALIGVAALILGLIFVVPTIGLGIIAVLTGKSAGLTWNPVTIALAVVVGCVLLAIFLYFVSLISVPAIVFFPAYALYFFAARYPRLASVLYPHSFPPVSASPPPSLP